jgi:hypothetical protein
MAIDPVEELFFRIPANINAGYKWSRGGPASSFPQLIFRYGRGNRG